MNRNLAEILERYPVDLAAMADEITKAVKSLEGMMGTKRPAEGPPQAVPVEPKRVKYQHPETKEEFEGTEAERDSTNGILVGWNSSQEWKCSIESWTTNATVGFGPTIGDSNDACVG